nr:hypothetical protein [Tanacetum cinerariifolium]
NSKENNRKPNAGRFEYMKRMEEKANVKEMGVNNKEVQAGVGRNTEEEKNDIQSKDNTKESKSDKNNP